MENITASIPYLFLLASSYCSWNTTARRKLNLAEYPCGMLKLEGTTNSVQSQMKVGFSAHIIFH